MCGQCGRRCAAALAAGILVSMVFGQGAARAGTGEEALPGLVPLPASVDALSGRDFRLERDSAIVVRARTRAREAWAVAAQLASTLRRSTGYRLPIRERGDGRDEILLELAPAGTGHEGYRLDAAAGGVRLRASAPAGLFHAVQTLRQLLPPRVESATVRPGPWTVPAVRIVDRPRFPWRGAMLDVARHFFSVTEVKRYIDELALYKINTLHLHLTDDQGWRIVIDRWPRLATYGGSLEVGGTPGGYYTKQQFAEIVRYAAERFIAIVPEVDGPGHTNAALASYAELNCDGVAPPLYTGTEVGFSSLCVRKEITYRFLDDVIREITALTPSPYYHVGGDEAHETTPEDYRTFIEREQRLVHAYGKRMMGWQEIAATAVAPGSIAQFWHPASGSEPGTELARTAVAKGMKLVMSPANRAYLDMKYTPQTPLGLSWAGYVEVRDSYSWDPATLVDGVGERDVLGVEGPLWSETIDETPDIEFMAFPRVAGLAEIGWSPRHRRSWNDYRLRLAAQGPRWDALGMNYYRSPQVPWPGA
jgi:hexosaminidase